MEEQTQQLIALAIVVAVVVLELVRRRRRNKAGKASCDGCESANPKKSSPEVKLKFYKRQ